MKSIKIFAAAGVIALLGMAGLSSCKTNNGPEGPGYNGEVVKTEFSIALPKAVGANGDVKRMAGDEVQSAGTVASFRGMDNMVLIPFASSTITSSSARDGSNITLPGTTNNTLASGDITNQGAKVYSNVTIPIGTRGFLFYAKAIDNAAGVAITSDADKHKFGILTPHNLVDHTPATMGFSLEQINEETNPTKGAAIVSYLNDILDADDAGDPTTIHWNDCATPYPALASFYDLFSSLRAGSSASVQRAVSDLSVLLRNYKRTGTTEGLALVEAIYTKIKAGSSTLNADSTVTLGAGLLGYPADILLPDGAAGLSYNTTSKHFELASTTNANGMSINTNASHHGLTNYVYPASLYYFVNSGLKASNASQADLYVNGKDWVDDILAAYTDGNEVSISTRSVAIQKEIQYAVGRLDLKVRILGDGDGYDELKDNDPQVSGGRTIDLSALTVSSFPVSAVLIGGQKNVDFAFVPSGEVAYTIYDNAVPAGFAAPINSWSAVNYTLALETAPNVHVKVAIELTNNLGQDFIGQGGQLIPKGSKFYLVGELNPETASAEEKAKTGSRVFKQDYTTVANFTIGVNSLQNAYNTIPDLRTSQLELGLSVDLSWNNGMAFDVTL